MNPVVGPTICDRVIAIYKQIAKELPLQESHLHWEMTRAVIDLEMRIEPSIIRHPDPHAVQK